MTAAEWGSVLPRVGEDPASLLLADAALEWLAHNTSLEFDPADPESVGALPAGAKLFVLRFLEAMADAGTVASESIGGMSQSFQTGQRGALLLELARTLIGKGLVKGGVALGPRCARWV